MIDQLLRLPAVRALTGVSRTGIYQLIASGNFPRAVRISERAVAWKASHVAAWMSSLPQSPARAPGSTQ